MLRVIGAEIIKQHRNWFNSKYTYFSLLLWPILIFINIYFSYKPFEGIYQQKLFEAIGSDDLMLFLIVGALSQNCFWAMVQTAWQMSYERQSGTLDIIFLAPANKLCLMYGRALGAIFESVWMLGVFSIIIISLFSGVSITMLIKVPIIFVILIISATVWGGLMNVAFLFSRDATFLFNIFDDPMTLFSGTRIPIQVFPIWAKVIASIFPLTHALVLIRKFFAADPIVFTDYLPLFL